MKKLASFLTLFGLLAIVPAEAARTSRPVVVVTTISTSTPPVSPF